MLGVLEKGVVVVLGGEMVDLDGFQPPAGESERELELEIVEEPDEE